MQAKLAWGFTRLGQGAVLSAELAKDYSVKRRMLRGGL